MQLTTSKRLAIAALGIASAFGSAFASERTAAAQVVTVNTTHGIYYEKPFRTEMFVYTPSVTLTATPWSWLSVSGGWEADVVSGASVKTKAGPAYKATQPAADVITTASVKDLRNLGTGNVAFKKDNTSFGGGYTYSTENDYKSQSFNVFARTELFEHNTQLQIDYAHNFDRVCDTLQSPNVADALRATLASSKGCFTDDVTRPSRGLAIDNLQGSWSQAWTPTFQTQLIYTLQIVNGFQSNPYRAVILGQGIQAQENHPENRARHALQTRGNIYIKPLKAALRLGLRGYWDTWDVLSGTAEIDFEKYFGEHFRVGLRGRFYMQRGALFWSDDYSGGDPPLGPKGRYFTGDRELSPFYSVLGGLSFTYGAVATGHRLLGFMNDFKLVGSVNMMQFEYQDYTLAGNSISNARAWLVNLGLNVGF
ncbi:hypothetical protein BH09MYX1_BH09MYX1_52040 [soil metagenome]